MPRAILRTCETVSQPCSRPDKPHAQDAKEGVCEKKKVRDLWELFEPVRLDLHNASLLMHQEEFPPDPGTGVVPCMFL
jgi:hypothetical protein